MITQDTCVATSTGAKQLWVSQMILNHAERLNLKHEDTFILVSKKLMFTRHEFEPFFGTGVVGFNSLGVVKIVFCYTIIMR